MKKFLFLYLLLTTLITVSILYPYSVRITSNLPNAIDPVFYAWNVGHNIQSLAHGGKNLLDTNIFYPEGNTLALSDTLIAQTVLAAPILLLTQNPVLAENLYILSTFVIAAVAMFCLSYNLTRHKAASACSGIFFAFAVPRIAQIGHMPALSSQWLPLFVLFLLKYLETGTWRDLWWTFLFYLLTITSTIYFGIFLIPVAAVALLVKGIRWKGIKTLAVSLLPMLVILITVLFPYIRLRAEYPGIKRGIDDAARLAAKIADYRTVLPTSWLSDLGMRTATNEEPLYHAYPCLAGRDRRVAGVENPKIIYHLLLPLRTYGVSFVSGAIRRHSDGQIPMVSRNGAVLLSVPCVSASADRPSAGQI